MDVAACPCSPSNRYDACCQPIHEGKKQASTAQELMRSRYSAYAKGLVPYLIQTCHASLRPSQSAFDLMDWCRRAQFLRLDILETKAGLEKDVIGMVKFVAWIKENGKIHPLAEASDFEREDGQWRYKSGKHFRQAMPGANEACPCGSGKKFKKCCG
jgi:SEC-C motif-containing protein